jgi:uncharacterized membrane protein (UPF0127 family)
LIAFNTTRNAPVATKVEKADTTASRNKGLLGRKSLPPEEALWIIPCPMIHTFFMKFPIDAIFLKRDLSVVRVIEDLKPWRVSPWVFAAHSVLELQGGMLKGSVRAGDRLEMRPS